MSDVEVAIDLRMPDNTAYTVLVALRQLGYDALARVERSEILRLNAEEDSPEALARGIAHAEVLFNPNKHRLSLSTTGAARRSDDDTGFEAVVEDRDDDTTGLLSLLQGPFGMAQLRSLSRAVAWRLYESGGPAPRERLEWACRELLANPHSQTFAVREMPARVAVEA